MKPDDEPAQSPPPIPKLGITEALLLEGGDQEKSELDKIIEMILDPANIAHNTALTKNEIKAFSALRAMVKKYDLPMMKEYLIERMILNVSESRKGRGEMIKILNRQTLQEHANMSPGMMNPAGRRRWLR